jgi:predicted acylesterase/phospholipase RssA
LKSQEFVARIQEAEPPLSNPLVNYKEQITGAVSVNLVDSIAEVLNDIEDEFTVISTDRLDPPEEPYQRVSLTCLIPNVALPAGWSNRQDVPNTLTILISAVPNLRIAQPVSNGNAHALILKGGGAKGYAYLGALEILESHYHFNWFIGTSAGAIAAVLLAAGYSIKELKEILGTKDFRDFFDAKWYSIPLNLALHHGCYKAEAFTSWLDELLAKKLGSHSRVKLSDLPYRATIFASRRDLDKLKFDPDENDVAAAYAVRCSMSIPLVFTPGSDQGLRTYDGGIQNNFPVQALLEESPETPFISFYLGSETYEPVQQKWVITDLISIWTEARDTEIIRRFRHCTVIIDPRPISTLDFSLSDQEREFLLSAGRAAAISHITPDSPEHATANKTCNELREVVKVNRKSKRRKRLIRWIVALVTCLSLCVVGYRFVAY